MNESPLTRMLLLNAAFCIENPADVPAEKRASIIAKLIAASDALAAAAPVAAPDDAKDKNIAELEQTIKNKDWARKTLIEQRDIQKQRIIELEAQLAAAPDRKHCPHCGPLTDEHYERMRRAIKYT